MRNFLLLLMFLTFLYCDSNNQIELDGNWIITEMTYDSESVYPKTLNQTIRIIYAGYENSESITFKVSDSTITLPGFESEHLKTEFTFEKGKLKINSNHSNSESKLTNKIFNGTYDWTFSNIEKTLKLKSDKTYINMISQEKIISDAVDKVFNGL
ncbi:hypothetical protein ADIWIN_0074 [Winogradskyella psychrotolerans RS-3]|uniref:Lipocalin-like domain-containing protein n=1 Tax=Winogradskyella psychrotolerans RS-3 TaxID=641526 RepID=S7VZP0_9FLAO|nr:hypothetical protein [Winogradskyella psychrotolerans]EPR74912.1 hypothetical protein ADIWIN_0074 [Winogradskyella psychrotolerans RS-3]